MDNMPRSHNASGNQLTLPRISKKQHNTLQVMQLKGDTMFEVHGVLTNVEAARFVDAVEQSGMLTHQSSRGPKYGEAFRDNQRVSVMDTAFAQHLWEASGLRQACQDLRVDGTRPSGLNPNIRIYRYGVGQRFGKHVDDTCEGGETVFYGAAVLSRWASYEYGTATTDHRGRLLAAVVPEAGKALLHLHGDDCLEHEAAVVTRGLKYVLRSDVVFS